MKKTGLEIVELLAKGNIPKKIKDKDNDIMIWNSVIKRYEFQKDGQVSLDLLDVLDDEYEIVEEPILTKKEKNYLKAVMSFEKDKPIAIAKTGDYYCGGEHIYIKYDVSEYNVISLRTFKKGTKFKDMEVDEEYTLEELGLDKDIEPPKSKKQEIYDQLKRYAEENNIGEIHWYNMHELKWQIYYNTKTKVIEPLSTFYVKDIGQIYFTSKEITIGAIKEIGEDNIKKLFEED